MLEPKDFPSFDGVLSFAASARSEVAEDFGHLSHQEPLAVLTPASIEDISRLLRFARAKGLKVSARGQGHGMGGQCLCEGGVVIDTRGLSEVRSFDADSVWAEAGLTWLSLVNQTLPKGLIPPGLTDHLGLSVGGTLSLGGIGGQAFRFGAQVDNVFALEVITGAGERIVCSPTSERELFEACLSGLGQFGVITAAKLKLVPAKDRVRTYEALYGDAKRFLDLQMELCRSNRFDYVAGMVVPVPGGGWGFLVQASIFYRLGEEPSDEEVSALLSPKPSQLTTLDRGLVEFLNRSDLQAKALQEAGIWEVPHPWLTQFFPRSVSTAFLEMLTSKVSLADIGHGYIAVYPVLREVLKAPLLPMPESEEIFLMGLLPNVLPPSKERTEETVALGRALYDEGRRQGSKLYPIGILPSKEQWAQHYGAQWSRVTAAKARFDPGRVLGPGVGVEYPEGGVA